MAAQRAQSLTSRRGKEAWPDRHPAHRPRACSPARRRCARAEAPRVQVLGHQGAPPAECTPEVMREIVAQHLESPAMWAIFPLQVWPGP